MDRPILTQRFIIHSFTCGPHIAPGLCGVSPVIDNVRVLEFQQPCTLSSPNFYKEGSSYNPGICATVEERPLVALKVKKGAMSQAMQEAARS